MISTMVRPPNVRATARLLPHGPRPAPFSTTNPASSALFNLGGLAHSRESQYLAKERGIPRTEYSAVTHLIRSSEVDPFGPAAPGSSLKTSTSRPQIAIVDDNAAAAIATPPPPQQHQSSATTSSDDDLVFPVPDAATVAAHAKTNARLIDYVFDPSKPAPARRHTVEILVAGMLDARRELRELRDEVKLWADIANEASSSSSSNNNNNNNGTAAADGSKQHGAAAGAKTKDAEPRAWTTAKDALAVLGALAVGVLAPWAVTHYVWPDRVANDTAVVGGGEQRPYAAAVGAAEVAAQAPVVTEAVTETAPPPPPPVASELSKVEAPQAHERPPATFAREARGPLSFLWASSSSSSSSLSGGGGK